MRSRELGDYLCFDKFSITTSYDLISNAASLRFLHLCFTSGHLLKAIRAVSERAFSSFEAISIFVFVHLLRSGIMLAEAPRRAKG